MTTTQELESLGNEQISETAIENKEQLISDLVSRVAENAPVKELIRVYCEALAANLRDLNDSDLIHGILNAGYVDIMETYNLGEIAIDLDA